MDIKGVCYDAGRAYSSQFLTRPVLDPVTTGRELQIIRDDLHCNAVRFQGRDITRLMTAAADGLELGLQVWLSPEMFEQGRGTTLAYLVRAATAAEPLRQRFPGRLVFCVGTESSLFTRGIVPAVRSASAWRTYGPRACNPAPMQDRSRRSSPKRASGSARCSTGRSPMPRPATPVLRYRDRRNPVASRADIGPS